MSKEIMEAVIIEQLNNIYLSLHSSLEDRPSEARDKVMKAIGGLKALMPLVAHLGEERKVHLNKVLDKLNDIQSKVCRI